MTARDAAGGAAPEKSGVTQGNACERALRGDPNVLAVKPRRGDALLFFNVHLNGEVDERAYNCFSFFIWSFRALL